MILQKSKVDVILDIIFVRIGPFFKIIDGVRSILINKLSSTFFKSPLPPYVINPL